MNGALPPKIEYWWIYINMKCFLAYLWMADIAKIVENNARLDAAVTIGIVRVKAKSQITRRICK